MLDLEDLKQDAYKYIEEVVDFFASDLHDILFTISISEIDMEEYKNGRQYFIYYSVGVYDYRNSGMNPDRNNPIDIFHKETIKGILCFRNCFIRNDWLWEELNRIYHILS